MRKSQLRSTVTFAAAGLALMACSKSTFHAPAVVPLIKASLPPSLGGTHAAAAAAAAATTALVGPTRATTATVTNSANAAIAEQSLQALFQDMFPDINGNTTIQGYVMAQVANVDERMAGIDTQVSSGMHPCLSNTPKSYTVSLASIDPMLTLDLGQLQCSNSFSNADGGNASGSGAVFGQSGNNYSLWTSLGGLNEPSFTAGGGFLSFANIKNGNYYTVVDGGVATGPADAGASEQVDGMFVAYFPQSNINEVTMVRYKASPTAGTFELFLASNRPVIQGPSSAQGAYFGAGFRMISDGTHIYSDGTVWNSGTSAWEPFTACINASDLSIDGTPADCDTLSTSFTISSAETLTYNEVTGATGTMPAPGAITSQTTPTQAIVDAINNIFPISNAASVTTAL